jgi:hypothetical protein
MSGVNSLGRASSASLPGPGLDAGGLRDAAAPQLQGQPVSTGVSAGRIVLAVVTLGISELIRSIHSFVVRQGEAPATGRAAAMLAPPLPPPTHTSQHAALGALADDVNRQSPLMGDAEQIADFVESWQSGANEKGKPYRVMTQAGEVQMPRRTYQDSLQRGDMELRNGALVLSTTPNLDRDNMTAGAEDYTTFITRNFGVDPQSPDFLRIGENLTLFAQQGAFAAHAVALRGIAEEHFPPEQYGVSFSQQELRAQTSISLEGNDVRISQSIRLPANIFDETNFLAGRLGTYEIENSFTIPRDQVAQVSFRDTPPQITLSQRTERFLPVADFGWQEPGNGQ